MCFLIPYLESSPYTGVESPMYAALKLEEYFIEKSYSYTQVPRASGPDVNRIIHIDIIF